MRILVVFTGGTIGSAKRDGYVALEASQPMALLESFAAQYRGESSFETLTPFTIHSENLNADTLTALMDCLLQKVGEGYDGILVTHGTDSLQYSAAAAAFCLGGDCTPVVFVSSNYPLEDPRANGALNFKAAIAFLQARAGRGVYVAYSNDLKAVAFHYAERVLAHSELSDCVFSVGRPPVLYQNGTLCVREDCVIVPSGRGVGAVPFCDRPQILELTVTPCSNYAYDPADHSAVVLRPYHSGTLPTAHPAFAAFCRRFADAGVPVFLPDVPSSTPYDSMREYDALGITVLPEMAQIPLLVKLWIGISIKRPLQRFVQQRISREGIGAPYQK